MVAITKHMPHKLMHARTHIGHKHIGYTHHQRAYSGRGIVAELIDAGSSPIGSGRLHSLESHGNVAVRATETSLDVSTVRVV